jgi:hypothetical protein
VTFDGVAYIRIGENKKKLADFKEHERALWLATGRRRFEQAIAMSNASLREHFSLPQDEYQAVSTIITSMVRAKRILPADSAQGKGVAKYIPYWAR